MEEFTKTVEIDSDGTHVKQFTDWPNEPTVENLKQDYTDARSDHDHHVSKVERWLDNLNVTGGAKKKKIKGRSAIVPKLIRKQAEWRYAALTEPFLSTDDVFNTAPVTYEDRKAAIQNGLVLNNQFNTKIQKVKFFDDYVRAAVDEGTVIVRVGWAFEEEEREVPDIQPIPIQDPAMAQQMMQMMQAVSQDPSAMEQVPPDQIESLEASMQLGQPVQMVEIGVKVEAETVRNEPTLEVCHYNNIMTDPTCLGDLTNAKFIIFSFETSLSELKKDGKYSNLENINVESNTILGEPDHDGPEDNSFNFTDEPRKKMVAYEYWGYWDYEGTGLVKPFVATWIGNTMIRMEESPFPDQGLPFVSAQYLPVRRSIYGEPDGELLEENQQVIGAVTRGMIDIMGRSANGQQASRKDALDTTNKRKFDRGEDYEFNPQVDPKQAFHMHVFPEIPNSAQFMLQLQNNEAESLSGVKAFAGSGITGQALGETATGVRSALDAVSKRELGILRRLAEGIKQIGRKMIAMNAVFLDEEEIIRITNDEFVPVKRDDLAGNIDLTLSISTAEADNDKAQELAFMLQTMGPNSDPAISMMIQADIARLRKMPALAQKLENYRPPPPDPLEVALKQLEVKKLEAEIAKLHSETIENQANANLDNAKARTEGSNADKTDLDFVEQESGVNQERDLEMAGAQARANIGLRAVDHGFNMREKQADAAIERAKPKPASK